ncbi:MAG: glycosyltransferase family 2 protein [Rhodobacteraceae bacterium]|nr:glycosyltransferase family 2 protein [Paracoccaceae bacterium]
MNNPTVLTVILNYKTPEMTVQSLGSALVAMQGIAGEIIVVDNDSQDGSFEAISKVIEEKNWGQNNRARVIQSGHNGGFGAGNNVGIRAGLSNGDTPDYIYILNSDAFPARDAISRLLTYLQENPQTGFVGSYIHGQDGTPHITAFRFPSIQSELEGSARFGPISRILRNAVVPLPMPKETCQVDWLAGASMMMRRTVLDEIGLFDEQFFLYFEETDLCKRARNAGWPTVYIRNSEVAHIGSVSTGMKTWARMPQYWFDSRWHYFVKNHGRTYATLATLAHIIGGILFRLRSFIQRKPRVDPTKFLRDLTIHALKSLGQNLLVSKKAQALEKTRLAGQESK